MGSLSGGNAGIETLRHTEDVPDNLLGNLSFGHGGGICRTQDGAEYQVQL
jgi:hypothetical protein